MSSSEGEERFAKVMQVEMIISSAFQINCLPHTTMFLFLNNHREKKPTNFFTKEQL